LLTVAIVWLSFYTKARREESFLTQEFGDLFAEHTKRTGMFLLAKYYIVLKFSHK